MLLETPGDLDAWLGLRLLVVVAHPDDEVLGCGVLLARSPRAAVIHVTDGAPQQGDDARRHGFADRAAYATARRDEARAALQLAGHGPERLACLGIPDQDASLHMGAVARAVADRLPSTDLVLTHAYEGGHPDHDAVAFAVHAARRIGAFRPLIIEMPFYFADSAGWARQRFLDHPDAGPEIVRRLSASEVSLKNGMVDAHASQCDTLRSFSLVAERFRRAPDYDFARLPHQGPLLYERHGWNLTRTEWRHRVAAAMSELGLDRLPCP